MNTGSGIGLGLTQWNGPKHLTKIGRIIKMPRDDTGYSFRPAIDRALEILGDKTLDRNQVKAQLVNETKTDADLADALILLGARDAVRHALEEMRRPNWEAVGPIKKDDVSGLVSLAQKNLRNIFDTYQLPNGTWLGEATKVDLYHAISLHQTQASSNMVKANWFKKLLPKLKAPTDKVSDKFTPEQVEKIRKRVSDV